MSVTIDSEVSFERSLYTSNIYLTLISGQKKTNHWTHFHGQVVSRRDLSKPQLRDTTLALLKIEDWLGYRGDSERRALHVYDPFHGTENLLFKDSTNGLVSTDSDIEAVLAYKDLFRHVDACAGASAIFAAVALVVANLFAARFV